ncbi:MAG TPA: hypothetical protein VF267_01725 [Gammaproteobacteria bacterium]
MKKKLSMNMIVAASMLMVAPAFAADAPVDHSMHHMESETAHDDHAMRAFYGPYSMSREASGTSWQPEAAPHEGRMFTAGDWQGMLHGFAQFAYTDQGGSRGDTDFYVNNMFMAMANRPLGDGVFGLRGMFSLEPETVGTNGYPLLLQTGETADGETHLLDRQHPHDAFMELAMTYSHPLGEDSALFLYAGLPGEPALGPPAFMHRFSGVEFPDSPISHHWLDSTHVTFGVFTAGYVLNDFKLEASAFRGREPDQHRWNIETGTPDSWATRVSWNPTSRWALQLSAGQIESPEALAPEVDTRRYTASAMHHLPTAAGEWQTLFAWGRNINEPGNTLDAFIIESAYRFAARHTLLARAERVEKDELFEDHHHEPVPGHVDVVPVFGVGKLSAGYLYDFIVSGNNRLGMGVVLSQTVLPAELESIYDGDPSAVTLFVRGRF